MWTDPAYSDPIGAVNSFIIYESHSSVKQHDIPIKMPNKGNVKNVINGDLLAI